MRDVPTDTRLDSAAKPAGGSVPAMLRRRLNLVGRAVCDMLPALDPEANRVVLHASRHGDGDRTLELLYTLAENDPISPARFGLSVHNAIVGVYSIASDSRRSQQAIAASGAEWAALTIEARGYLADGEDEVLVVFADQPVPARFAAYAPETPPAAVALRLGARPAPGSHRLVVSNDAAVDTPRPPQPLDVIDWLLATDDATLACPMTHRRWQLAAST